MKGDLLYRVTHDGTMPGERRLLLAVVGMACRDYRRQNGHAASARRFLDGEGFELYARVLGFSPERLWEALVAAGELS